ncbi:MAG: ATP-binding cassette domain-containing protein [Proteobacteria bacterium]|nr:ATP-binding cassette domain-containing protein [Pseudomonadota bacterium]MBU1584583.1 ATP-binding cassette domain-containing protein [Pseudomonadota bacterium]MBU2453079.1 ATP-binding cassette domain-containing protein [Pseudomonadota bacterium]MBU2631310.1 ATP-binding cassette domain-containing protein [Pseudomonadota bacterium]
MIPNSQKINITITPETDKMIVFESVYLKQKNKDIFLNFNLVVQKNEKILIQGKSGIGKTTLFKLVLGFEKMDQGSVTFNGYPIDKVHIKEIREQVFYLSQDIDLKKDKVGLLLDEILTCNPKRTIKDSSLTNLMSFLDLNPEILEQNVKALSGGERQRVGLLICFLLDRPVWLLDEPTSALDDAMKKKIAAYVLDQDKTIIIISHDDVWKKNGPIKIERWL